jgi:hypothetical protein
MRSRELTSVLAIALCLSNATCKSNSETTSELESDVLFGLTMHLWNSPCQPYGIVTGADGEPVADASIEILPGPRAELPHLWKKTGILTNDQGEYELPVQANCPKGGICFAQPVLIP